jgi:hypothetical protein
MEQKRKLLIGGVALVMGKVKNAGEAMVAVWELQLEVGRGVGSLAKRRRWSGDPVDAEVYAVDHVISASLYCATQHANRRRIK